MNKDELKELAATLNGIADGKAWDVEYAGGYWGAPSMNDDHDPTIYLSSGYKIRLKPWQLPQPPDGMQWHRDDWTEEMLPEGWRPLLHREKISSGDQWFTGTTWVDRTSFGTLAMPHSSHHRTKRPIPQPQQPDPYAELKAAYAAGKVIQYKPYSGDWTDTRPSWVFSVESYRIKPGQQKVPLGPDDIPPGTVLRGAGEASELDHQGWCMITSSSITGIRIWRHCDPDYQHEITWQTLMDAESEIWRPTDTSWQPCYKLIDTP